MQLHTHHDTPTNVKDGERILSAIGGSLLVYYVTKKHKASFLLLMGGAYLLYRAVSGQCPVAKAWKESRTTPPHPKRQDITSQTD